MNLFLSTLKFPARSCAQQPEETRLADLNARFKKARLEYEAFQTSLYAAHPELRVQRGEAKTVTLEETAELLPDAQSALLEYVVTDEKTYLFVLSKGDGNKQGAVNLKSYTLPIKRKELADQVAAFRQQLAKRDLTFRQAASRLYDVLVKPAQAELKGKQTLVIVPDGALWELPFQALQDSSGRYLIEDHALSYAPSLTVLREMSKLRKKKAATRARQPCWRWATPNSGRKPSNASDLVHRDERLDPLPEAEREVKTLAQLYGAAQSKVYIGAEAREDRLKAEAGRFSVLHLATHGILNDASPMYSQVVLAQSAGRCKRGRAAGGVGDHEARLERRPGRSVGVRNRTRQSRRGRRHDWADVGTVCRGQPDGGGEPVEGGVGQHDRVDVRVPPEPSGRHQETRDRMSRRRRLCRGRPLRCWGARTIATRSTGPDSSWSVMEDKEGPSEVSDWPGNPGRTTRGPLKNQRSYSGCDRSLALGARKVTSGPSPKGNRAYALQLFEPVRPSWSDPTTAQPKVSDDHSGVTDSWLIAHLS